MIQKVKLQLSCEGIFEYLILIFIQVAERVKEFFHNEGIHSTTIQPEFVETGPGEQRDGSSISSAEAGWNILPKFMRKKWLS